MEGGNPLPPEMLKECTMVESLPKRKHPVHPPPLSRFNLPVVLFVSVSVRDRKSILANECMHEVLKEVWLNADQWRVGSYMIMPDHVHLFCVPGVLNPVNVKMWVKYWKGNMRKSLNLSESIWQSDCWDTQMRDAEHYHEKRFYVRENPVRKGLVANAAAWPYQGEMHIIGW